jgi:hypothetical protein
MWKTTMKATCTINITIISIGLGLVVLSCSNESEVKDVPDSSTQDTVINNPLEIINLNRIVTSLSEHQGRTTCAASFVYGTYVDKPNSVNDLLNEGKLRNLLGGRSNDELARIPEYTVLKYFKALREGDRAGMLACFEPNHSREEKRKMSDEEFAVARSQARKFSQIVFLDRCKFGVFHRLGFMLRNPPEPGIQRKGPAIPASLYLRELEGKCFITKEVSKTSIFEDVASYWSYQHVVARSSVPISHTQVSELDSFAVDIKSTVREESWELSVKRSNVEGSKQNERSPEDSSLNIYFSNNSEGIEDAVKSLMKLTEFYESGDFEHALSFWSERSRQSEKERINEAIQRGTSVSAPFEKNLQVIRVIRDNDYGVVFYYDAGSLPGVLAVRFTKHMPVLSYLVYSSDIGPRDVYRDNKFLEGVSLLAEIE